jgi:hypothetical protein
MAKDSVVLEMQGSVNEKLENFQNRSVALTLEATTKKANHATSASNFVESRRGRCHAKRHEDSV